MQTAPETVTLAQYQPPTHLITSVSLTFRLAPRATRVLSALQFTPNPARPGAHDLRLDGENLTLISTAIDGKAVVLTPDATGLTIPAGLLPNGPFLFEAEVEI